MKAFYLKVILIIEYVFIKYYKHEHQGCLNHLYDPSSYGRYAFCLGNTGKK